MTIVTILFALVVLLVLGAVALSVSVLLRRDAPASRLVLGLVLIALAAAIWLIGIQTPLPLP
jgi:hypothetical protein